jgi:hypothetical protein
MTVNGSLQAALCVLSYGFNALLEVLLYFAIKDVGDNIIIEITMFMLRQSFTQFVPLLGKSRTLPILDGIEFSLVNFHTVRSG